ncbi:ComE operon protein 1 [Acinetobacter stercoris]|uniref:ComE operon protein 1 n=2 Tax=Acinetobacter stercoris TaxID=2126983 RepID=A0A2U3MV53_9GAMM|nr:ComE operon protein 1 [Acinetobacter stercoris]
MAGSSQSFDQNYLKWKEAQHAQDQRLKESNDDYYLSKPALMNKSSGSASGIKASQSTSNRISLNRADLLQLQQLKGVGAKKAQAIIEYRQQNGNFKTIEDIQKVKGIGPKMFENNKSLLTL